ncbi:molybdopterin-guanine dinucleotide biosynthesis protein B [Iodidimonas sp. SYSU 1G8]|uniref:molybdopterin-guanine dinucleotide biosynthesis protein B n=1 Tax=Iodidimonas sp. SYSU 1G8 TaxID=3133967 RepID=UPI0031FEB22C
MHVMGIVGWKNSGKTTLVVELVRLLTARGLRVGTIKHAHHDFDIDHPGKDSYRHREAGATDVIVASGARWAQVHELRGEAEPELDDLLPRLSPDLDIVLVEGFKRDRHAKIEVVPAAFEGRLLTLDDPHVIALASDAAALPPVSVPVLSRSDPAQVADFIMAHLGLGTV